MHTYSTNLIKTLNAKTDPLVEILNNINKNPAVYINRQPINNKSLQQEAKAKEQYSKRADTSQKEEGVPQDNRSAFQGSEVKRTKSGCIVKKTRQINIPLNAIISPANMSATPSNVIWLAALSLNSKHLFVQNFAGWPTG